MILSDPNVENLEVGEILTQEHLYNEYVRLSDKLTKAIEALFVAGTDWATKNSLYRKAKSKALLEQVGGKNRDEREAKASPFFEQQKFEAELSEALKEATLEQVRGLRTQLSALQTIVASRRSELEATAYGQTGNK
jgi:hypothetical protein